MLTVVIALALLHGHRPDVQFTVDLNAKSPISPYVYGVNNPVWDKMQTPFTVARMGGNRMSAYNWETNASNAGNDWHFQNDSFMGESNEAGYTMRKYMEDAQAHGAAVLMTVPTMGHVAADKKGDGDVNQTPDYLNVRFIKSYPKKPGKFTYPPDVNDNAVYEDEFVWWFEKVKSPKTPVYYILDNEPDLWNSTHERVWQTKPTYAYILQNGIDYASAIKDVAPKTLVFAPSNYGWQGFRTFQDAPDAGGRDFLDFYLSGMRDAGQKAHKRLLDVLDIHFYPEAQGDGKRITDPADTPGLAAARIQAPRTLWDPTYVEDSWITKYSTQGKAIDLLHRVLGQIQTNYPGTKLAINEYNYGGGKVPSGMVAQADVLGVYGRYGLFAACNWGIGPDDTAEIAAFRAFLDFDGKGAKFGDLGLSVHGENAPENSLYAALDSKDSHRLTLVAINKTAASKSMSVQIPGFQASSARAFGAVYSAPFDPVAVDCSLSGMGVQFSVPAFGVVTVELKK
jgi:hypothetical protein